VSESVPANLAPPEGIGPLRRQRLAWARLYFVCEGRPRGRNPEDLLKAAFSGGVGMLELRDRELAELPLAQHAETFRRLADTYGAPFIVNDDPELALELNADGVHVGQDDIPPGEAREILGSDAIVGLSTHCREQIEAAQSEPVDYISVGPVWETPTKEGRSATGLELIRTASEIATMPWFAIGGIGPDNIAEVISAGAKRVCVVRAIRDAPDPRAAAQALISALDPEHRAAG
jgi:thiamine-phosphate pyrophosphorylase